MDSVFLYHSRFNPATLIEAFKDFIPSITPISGCNVLLRWGNLAGSDKNIRFVINRQGPLKASLDKDKVFETLRINRIRKPLLIQPRPDSHYPLIAKKSDPVTGFPESTLVENYIDAQNSGAALFVEHLDLIKKYKVYIFDLNVFSVTKKIAVKTHTGRNTESWQYEEIPKDLDQDTQKVCQLAQRTLYILGLDVAMLQVGIDVRGRPVILDVSPAPVLASAQATLLYELVLNFINKQANKHHWRKTEDTPPSAVSEVPFFQPSLFPEKSCTPAGKDNTPLSKSPIQPASAVLMGADPEFVLRDSMTGKMVYPSEYLPKDGKLGYDERSERREGRFFPLAEIRPEPEFCPVKLTNNIREIMVQALKSIPPNIEWLAGSVQFENYQIGGHIHFSNLKLDSGLLRALDNYLAIPVFLIEDPATSASRRRQYGWIGSFRYKPHGGFEYRTTPSWLVSPDITLGCLCLAKIVATDYLWLDKDLFADPELQKAFYQGKKFYFYDLFSDLWADLEQAPLYSKYASYLTPFHELISQRLHWNESLDLRKAWGLLP